MFLLRAAACKEGSRQCGHDEQGNDDFPFIFHKPSFHNELQRKNAQPEPVVQTQFGFGDGEGQGTALDVSDLFQGKITVTVSWGITPRSAAGNGRTRCPTYSNVFYSYSAQNASDFS